MNLPTWLSNAYQNYFQQTQDVNNKSYQQYGGPTVAPINQNQYTAEQWAQQGSAGALPTQAGQTNALQNVIGGQFNVNPSSNPWMGA